MNRVSQHPVQAYAAALAAVAILSIMDAVMKALVLAIGIYAVSIWRSVLNLILTSGLYLPRRLPWPNRPTFVIHLLRGAVTMVMAALFFWGIGRVPLAQAIALTFIAPLIALLLAAVLLDEKIGPRSITGSFAAFAGVLIIVMGQARAAVGPDVMLGSIAIIGSALCYAVNIVLMRRQALAAKPLEINFFQSLTVLFLWALFIPVVGFPAFPSLNWHWVVVASLLSTAGGFLFAWAYARGEAGYLSTTEYSGFLWAAALGWLVFHEPVSSYTVAGATLIVAGCIFAARVKASEPPAIDVAV